MPDLLQCEIHGEQPWTGWFLCTDCDILVRVEAIEAGQDHCANCGAQLITDLPSPSPGTAQRLCDGCVRNLPWKTVRPAVILTTPPDHTTPHFHRADLFLPHCSITATEVGNLDTACCSYCGCPHTYRLDGMIAATESRPCPETFELHPCSHCSWPYAHAPDCDRPAVEAIDVSEYGPLMGELIALRYILSRMPWYKRPLIVVGVVLGRSIQYGIPWLWESRGWIALCIAIAIFGTLWRLS